MNSLNRLDVHLASRAVDELTGLDPTALIHRFPRACVVTQPEREAWITGVLAVRGIKVDVGSVRAVLSGRREARLARQERVLISGLDRALERIIGRAQTSELPNGWFTVGLFETVTHSLPRFTNNQLRRDAPWDALVHRSYPKPDALAALLDGFTAENRYRDVQQVWDREHPVRQGFRAMWRLARIAPFPDFNLAFAFVFMNAFHLACGYPLLVPEASDRQLLESVVSGGPPHRIVQFESRLLATVR